MAYPSSRGGSSSGASRSSRQGSSPNLMPYAVAVIFLVLVVVLVMVLGSKKGKAPAPPPATVPTPAPVVPAAPAPVEKPYPPIAEATLAKGRDLVKTFEADGSRAEALYQESMKAKGAGDESTWQSKLKEARTLAEGIKDEWNEFIASLPRSKDYDEEQVAKHYFYRESGAVAKLTQRLLAAMKTDER